MGFVMRDTLEKEVGFSAAKVASKSEAGKSSRLS